MDAPQVSVSQGFDYDTSQDIDLDAQSKFVLCLACREVMDIWQSMAACMAAYDIAQFDAVARPHRCSCAHEKAATIWFWRNSRDASNADQVAA